MVPIFVCVVLPVAIVAIVYAAQINNANKRAMVLIKAIEAHNGIDADKLAEALQKPRRTALELLNLRLLRGCIFTFFGIVLCAIGVVALCVGVDFAEDGVVPFVFGGASLAVGLSYLVVYFVSRRQLSERD